MLGGQNRKPSLTRQGKRDYSVAAATTQPVPPVELSAGGKEQFDRLIALLPDGSAAHSDSAALGILAELLAGFWSAPAEFPASRMNILRGFLNDFGLTMTARQRQEIAPVREENPFAAVRGKA